MGRAREDCNFKKGAEEKDDDHNSAISTWSLDYTYFANDGQLIRHGDDEAIERHRANRTLGRPTLAGYDRKTKTGYLHDADQKEPEDAYILYRTVKDIDEAGCIGSR